MKLARMPDGSPEIFHTLQGEGRHTGRPSVFIRSSLCNLYCSWCDTPYTWKWEEKSFTYEPGYQAPAGAFQKAEQILDLSNKEIAQAVEAFSCRNLVLTGGEPLVQEKAWVSLLTFLETSPRAPFTAEMETNGTLFPGEELLRQVQHFNVSPKLVSSGIPADKRVNPEVLTRWSRLAAEQRADFKFVVSDSAGLEEVLDFVATFDVPSNRVFLMPEARSEDELRANQSFASEAALRHGFHFSDRLHIRLYGAKRGV